MIHLPLRVLDRAGHLWSSLIHKTWYSPLPSSPLIPLLPLLYAGSKLYELGLRYDQQRGMMQEQLLSAPVISIGNMTTGGTGKTPLTIWLARHFSSIGRNPAILTRGYGRRGQGISQVPLGGDLSNHAFQLGDEPTLMAERLGEISPVWVGRDRWSSGRKAIQSGADILLMDDGFQYLRLHRDLDLVLLDAKNPFGNGSLLPLGPLREPMSNLNRADAIIFTRADDAASTAHSVEQVRTLFPEKPVFACRHKLMGPRFGLNGPSIPLPYLNEHTLIAFAGIAKPKAFFNSLGHMGLQIAETMAYPDHYQYGREDLAKLFEAAKRKKQALLVTTEKDFVRLPAHFQGMILTVELEMDFGQDHAAFCSFLGNVSGH